MQIKKAKILFLSRHRPEPVGGGGIHRSYQIYQELIETVGSEQYIQFNFPSLLRLPGKKQSLFKPLTYRLRLAMQIFNQGYENKTLINQFIDNNSTGFNSFRQISQITYKHYIDEYGKPDVCISDHPNFLPAIQYNLENDIPTIYCPANFEAFDFNAHYLDNDLFRKQLGISLIYELEALISSKERLMISSLEKNIVNGLGIQADYYPYLPIGKIRDRLEKIREHRQRGTINRNLFLLIGSVNHVTTHRGFSWFLQNALETGLPEGTKIVVCGRDSETLSIQFQGIPGIEILGFLKQEDLDNLLEQACSVLIPQLSGFGFITRISEMACAGIPVIVSQHPTLGLSHTPPGVYPLGNVYSNWVDKMSSFQEIYPVTPFEEYLVWEANQPKPLISTIKKYL